jgi:hypothetical protein
MHELCCVTTVSLCKCSHTFVHYVRHLFACRQQQQQTKKARCGLCVSCCSCGCGCGCSSVVLLQSVRHENSLKYREERIPEISNLWLSLKFRMTDVFSFQITVPLSVPPPLSVSLPVSIHLLVTTIITFRTTQTQILHTNSRSTQNSQMGSHIFVTRY